MIHFAVATPPEIVKDKRFLVLSYLLALWTVGISVAQMVGFEDFVNALRDYHIVGQRGGLALAITLLAVEIFSVPFWLRLSLSPAARAVSALFAAVSPFVWAFLTLSALVGNQEVANAGYFGGFFSLPVNVVVLAMNIVWIVAVAFSFGKLGGHRALRAKVKR